LNIAARRDDRIGMLGGKGAAARRTAGLDEGWAALGRRHGPAKMAAYVAQRLGTVMFIMVAGSIG
jgi:hypothetical protein